MPFKVLPSRARKDPFAFTLLSGLIDNQRATEGGSLAEHAYDGTHNALEVARAVTSVVWDGSAYSLEGNNSVVTSITAVSTGVVVVNLDSAYFVTPMEARISIMDDGAESLPWIYNYKVLGVDKVQVSLRKLASLGGNTWNLTDGSFCIAVHSKPYVPSGSKVTSITDAKRGDTLGRDKWNQLVVNQAELRSRLLVHHRTDGQHNAREVAQLFSVVGWDGTDYALTDGSGVTSVAKVSPGVCRVTAKLSTPAQVFLQPDYDRTNGAVGDITLAHVPHTGITSTKFDVYLYAYDATANTWAKADFGFAASIHQEPS